MKRRDLTCEEAKALAEVLLEDVGAGATCRSFGARGEGDAPDGTSRRTFGEIEGEVRKHLSGCASCRARFGFDLALVEAMRDLPVEPLQSVTGEVMSRLAARERRLGALRWGVVVSAAAMAGIIVNAFGVKLFEYMYSVLTRGITSTGEFLAYNKVVGILRLVVGTLGRTILGGSLGADLSPYRAQVWAMVAGALVVVLFMMYLMGLWLRQPKGVRSWHSRSLWHNVMQVW